MNECIVERQKVLIWSENTYKQKRKPEWEEEGRSGDSSAGFPSSLPLSYDPSICSFVIGSYFSLVYL
jgi:hypothetical protein